MARPVAQDLFNSLMMDIWPQAAAIVDFGLSSEEHYRAMQRPIRAGEITLEQLDQALGDGPALTRLAQAAESNPHKDIVFETPYDIQPED